MPHTRPPQASRALRPAGLLNRPRRPLSRGFDQASCPARPLVSYQINRQLSGWNLPPLVIRAVGAHWEIRAHRLGDPAGPIRTRESHFVECTVLLAKPEAVRLACSGFGRGRAGM